MHSITVRRTLATMGVAVMAMSTVACGSDGGSGGGGTETASREDFCNEYAKLIEISDGTGESVKKWAKGMEDTGLPENASDDEKDGFEILMDEADKLEDDKKLTEQEPEKLSDEDEKKVKAFNTYAEKECKAEIKKATDEMMKDMGAPSGMPSTEPSPSAS